MSLLVPFAVWSLVYFGLRVVKFDLAHQNGRVAELVRDPVALFLSGGSSIAPLFFADLFTGLVMIRLFHSVLCHAPSWLLVVMLVIVEACNEILVGSGQWLQQRRGVYAGFSPGLDAMPPARLVLAILAHAMRCAPLIFAAALAVRYLPLPGLARVWPLLAGAFLFIASAFVTLKISYFQN